MNNRQLNPYPMAELSTTRERPHKLGQGYLIPYAEAWDSADELLIEVKLPISTRSEATQVTFEQGILTIYGLHLFCIR